MTTNVRNAIRESVATTWTTGCTTVLPQRLADHVGDLDAQGSRMRAAQRPVQPAVSGTPSFGAAFGIKARAAKSAPGTTACRPPT